jgi:hypothetical protein
VNEAYETHMRAYRTFKTVGTYDEALKELDAAIVCRPCDEALPTLTAMREELVALVKPVSWWARALGVAR